MSANGWKSVPLGELLSRNEKLVTLLPEERYQEITIRLWGKGVLQRGVVNGIDISADRRFQVSASQFIVSRIDARNGAMGIIPPELDNAIVTNDFPSFNVNRDKMIPEFLGWLCRTADFVDKCRSASEGTTNRVRLKEERFMQLAIPLPPLEEQRRIVSRVDSLVAKIEEVKTLRKQSTSQLNAVSVSLAHRGDLTDDEKSRMGWKAIRLGDFIRTEYDDHKVQTCEEYPNLGIYSYGRGLFVKPPISGMATSAAKLRKVHSGQFIYSRLFAWEGAFGLVTPEFDGWYVSGEYPTFACDQHHILPEFLFAYFKTEQAWKKVAIGSKGLGSRRQRVQPEQILNHCLLLPPMDIQEKIKWTLESAAKGRIQILEAEASIDVLLPSILDRAFQGGL